MWWSGQRLAHSLLRRKVKMDYPAPGRVIIGYCSDATGSLFITTQSSANCLIVRSAAVHIRQTSRLSLSNKDQTLCKNRQPSKTSFLLVWSNTRNNRSYRPNLATGTSRFGSVWWSMQGTRREKIPGVGAPILSYNALARRSGSPIEGYVVERWRSHLRTLRLQRHLRAKL